ncbi:hypothetical protein D8674_026468 [Pyrus ussuriensis x Pyrus communis]|uniref:Uncharacterized protein n=1 Tax=Pyrus ussuriensis x Pyrus communis TaxID=2448454 RepID=A0A5N5ILH9_9ROSA|nr:hypothetical protein D8674_026468 [Pyrus ussuriensis x Pyrus communis]
MAVGLKSIALFCILLLITSLFLSSMFALVEAQPLSSSSRPSRYGVTREIEDLFIKAVNTSGPSPRTGGHRFVNLTTPLAINVKKYGPSRPGQGHH